MKSYSVKKDETTKQWWIIDLKKSTQPLGRIATKASILIRGKHKVKFVPNFNNGDNVIVINTDSLKFSGDKRNQKMYYRHSGYFGNLKERNLDTQMAKDSTLVFREAVKGTLSRNTMRKFFMRNLYIYKDANHNHQAQQPMEAI